MHALYRIKHSGLQRHPSHIWLVLSFFLLGTACGGSDDNPPLVQPVDTQTTTQETIVPEPPVKPDPFPNDTDGDDRPSVIVTGLNGSDPSEVKSQWLANIYFYRLASRTPGTGDGRIVFLRYEPSLALSRHIDFFEKELDTCTVSDPREPSPGSDSNPPPLISAGPTAVINTPNGAWFTFDRTQNDNNEWVYRTDNELPSAIPERATLMVAGDEFPTVSAYPIFEPEAPQRLLPSTDGPISGDSAYAWDPGKNKTYMEITFDAYDDANEFVGGAGSCFVKDDGVFTMPEEVKEFVESTDLDLYAFYTRVYSRIDLKDDIVFRQQVEVGE